MNSRFFLLFLVVCFLVSCGAQQPASPSLNRGLPQQIVKDEFIIQLYKGHESELQNILDVHDLELITTVFDFYHVQSKQASDTDEFIPFLSLEASQTHETLAHLTEHPSVSFASHHFVDQPHFSSTSQSFGCDPNTILRIPPNDPDLSKAWHLKGKTEQCRFFGFYCELVGIGANVEQAWTLTKGSRDVIIGIVESGTDYCPDSIHMRLFRPP